MTTQLYAAPEGIDPRQYPHIDFSLESSRYQGPRYVRTRDGIGDTDTGRFVFRPGSTLHSHGSPLDDHYEDVRERMVVVNGD